MDAALWTPTLTTAVGGTAVVAALVAVAVALARTVVRDGYGTRPGPRSHHGPLCAAAGRPSATPCDCR